MLSMDSSTAQQFTAPAVPSLRFSLPLRVVSLVCPPAVQVFSAHGARWLPVSHFFLCFSGIGSVRLTLKFLPAWRDTVTVWKSLLARIELRFTFAASEADNSCSTNNHSSSLRAIQLANQAIHEEAARNPIYAGMGSTIVAVLVEGNLFSLANVGDSRVYVIRGEAIQQLTNDHSLVMEQVRRGLITPEEAQKSAIQNVLVRALGSEESVEPDLEDHEFTPGDILLLCSDGLSRYVKESMIMEVSRGSADLEQACENLIDAAKSGGSDDNITCLLLRAVEQR